MDVKISLVFALALGFIGCGGGMGRAMHAFDEGRYPDAVGEFRWLENESRDWSPRDRARYALYRGLTHLSCGDAREATRWIGYAKLAHDRDPHLFDVKERGRLLAAWRSMGLMPGELARAPRYD